ncbi:hypothetical protein X732_31415 [Mesorhizobium sp. L2C066B000]|nr:hypothetical protein X732_31415 [Mesorhizobium sp. L2C066B000]
MTKAHALVASVMTRLTSISFDAFRPVSLL